ncbi:MAG: hypothetical protein RLZZ184_1499 [Cyanobacteriota bacterium]|jgi:hypothetical protein
MYAGFILWVEKIGNYLRLDKFQNLYYAYVMGRKSCAHIYKFFKH